MKSKILILVFIALAVWTLESQAQSSFIKTTTQSAAGDDYGNAITEGGNFLYVTGSYNGQLYVKQFTKSTLTLVGSWVPGLGALPGGTSGKIGYDIEYYNNYLYVTATEPSVIYVIKIDVSTPSIVSWTEGYVGPVPNGCPYAGHALSANAGGVTLIGTYNGSLDFGGFSVYDPLPEGVFLAKFDLSLTPQWLSGIPSSHGASGRGISTVQISGTWYSFITGYFGHTISGSSANIQFPGATINSYGGTDVFVAKFLNNNSGLPASFDWARHGGTALSQSGIICGTQDAAFGITATAGNVWITGKLRGGSANVATFGTLTISCATTPDYAFVARYTSSGTCSWVKKAYQNCINTFSQGYDIALNGNYLYVTGGSNSTNPTADIFVSRIAAGGGAFNNQTVTQKIVGAAFGIGAGGGIVADACDVYICGRYSGGVQFGLSATQAFTSNGYDYFVSKLSTLSSASFGTPNCAASAQLCGSGGGTYSWSTGETTACITVNPVVQTHYTVTITDPTSSCTNAVPITFSPSYPANAGPDICVACPGGCVTIGTDLPPTGVSPTPTFLWTANTSICSNCETPVLCNYTTATKCTVTVTYPGCPSTTDQMLFHGNCTPCRMGGEPMENPNISNSLTVNPNPSEGHFFIKGTYKNDPVLVYDAFGKLILKTVSTGADMSIDLTGHPKGLYLIVAGEENNAGMKKVIVD